ncbi:hypothetical protein ACFXJ8_33100 [Nonomuraea sp. NPDC059194]|uniref:hypothetical protein n=1 Tax=Nonomuraea sp. NPDC059194 TaxID=3346764 RepID=UPI0036B7466B
MSIETSIAGLLFIIPTVILLIVGVVLTARARAEHGRGATFGLVGCVVLLVGAILQAGWQIMMPSIIESSGLAVFSVVYVISGFVFVVVNTLGMGLLIGGVIARRTPPQAQHYPQPPQGWQQPPPPGQWPAR